MMFIWDCSANNVDRSSLNRPRSWWLGYGGHKAKSRVVTFQADGHELEMILEAMKNAHIGKSGSVELCAKFHEGEE